MSTYPSDLYTYTYKRNLDLEDRVAELEQELAAWKMSHATITNMAERDKRVHHNQVASLTRQLSSSDTLQVGSLFSRPTPRSNAHLFST